jgi:cytoskeletal protein CcmA (bactofilin family)
MQTNKDAQRGPSTVPSVPVSGGRTTSYLGPNLHIKGEITGNEDLKLESTVEGQITIGGFRLTVGPSARVSGDIVAREAVISGQVLGDVRVCDRIEITKNASIEGDLSTAKIVIEEGAYFKGSLDIGSDGKQIGTDLDSLLNSSRNANSR